MKVTLKKLVAAGSVTLLAACGGSGGNAAMSKSFNYSAPTAPSTSEQAAADSAQTGLASTADFNSTPTADKGLSVVTVLSTLADSTLGSSGIVAVSSARANAGHLLRSAVIDATCAVQSGNTVTFNNCQESESGFNMTLNGHVTANAGVVSWEVTGGFSGTSNNVTFNINLHYTGDITVTATTLKGSIGVEVGGNVSSQGQSMSFGVAEAVLADITYQSAPTACVTSGSLEAKRVWTTRPQGANASQLPDVGVKLTWSSCGTVQVAHSQ